MDRKKRNRREKGDREPRLLVTGRIRLVFVVLFAFLVVCGARVGYLQLCMGAEKVQRGRAQQVSTTRYYVKRGQVVDRNQNVLALTVPFKHIEVVPPVNNKEFVARFIAGATGLSVEQVWKRSHFDRPELPRWPEWDEALGFFGDNGFMKEFRARAPRPIVFFQLVDPNMTRTLEEILAYAPPTRRDERKRIVPDWDAADAEMLWLQEQLKGVRLNTYGRRLNPYRELAGATLGLTRLPQEDFEKRWGRPREAMDQVGVSGIEAAVEPWIAGRIIKQVGLKRQGHRTVYLPGNPELDLKDYTVQTTLDVEMQRIAEQEIERGVINARAKQGVVVILDTKDSELRAIAQYPPFNPTAAQSYQSAEMSKMIPTALALAFEPGSTVKGLLDAAALNEGVITREERIFCEEGEWFVDKNERPITDTHKLGWTAMDEAMKVSSNIFHGKIALLHLGPQKTYEYYNQFGFGELTNVLWDLSPEIPEEMQGPTREARGRLAHWKKWTTIDTANAGFGHGFSVNAIQLVAAFGALANDGVWRSPVLIKSVRDGEGEVVAQAELVERRVTSTEAAHQAVELMERVTEDGGTGERASVYGVAVSGKTGTAAKAIGISTTLKQNGKDKKVTRGTYMEGRYVASFVGMVPSRAPRYVILVVVDEPGGSHAGGDVAGPVFSKTASRVLAHTSIIEGRDSEVVTTEEAPVPQEEVEQTENVEVPEVEPEILSVGATKVPDMSGMTVRKALEVMQARRLKMEANGAGRVTRQEPAAGTVVLPGSVVTVTFERGEQPTETGEQSK